MTENNPAPSLIGSAMNDGKHIFVFGSNLAGRHGKGAAKCARADWGAVTGIGVGRTGMAYAIPTKGHTLRRLPLPIIRPYVLQFIDYAQKHEEFIYLLTRIGCGLAGYEDWQIATMFLTAPTNVVIPKKWEECW